MVPFQAARGVNGALKMLDSGIGGELLLVQSRLAGHSAVVHAVAEMAPIVH